MREIANAKINLCLDVIRKRDDGYHELEMIMVPTTFYDVIEINLAKETTLEIDNRYLPINERNTIIKAINVLREEYGFKENFKISLHKVIPTQAGLGGGSADAAATIRLLRRMLRLDMDQDKMIALATKVGADVPFCCINKPALVKGIGENLESFDNKLKFNILLVKPQKGISTKDAFSQIDFNEAQHPNVSAMKEALETGNYQLMIDNLVNTLEEPSFRILPEIKEIKNELLQMGFDGALMSGSGSTVFGITKDDELFFKASETMKKNGRYVRRTTIK